MGQLFAYSMASALLLTAMYLIYKWMMAAENQHRFNRGVLLGIYAAALALPLLMKVDFASLLSTSTPHEGQPTAVVGTFLTVLLTGMVSTPLWLQILLGIYVAGMATVAIHTLIVALRLAHLLRSGERHPHGNWTLVLVQNQSIAPFSWGRYMVMSHADFNASGRVISIHEARHIRSLHWLDMLVAQVFVILQWYNPTAWLMREELRTVHEYEADDAVLTAGVDPYEYQMLLIKKAVGARFPSLANSLNHSKLKKRVTMMYKNRSGVRGRIRSLALLPAAAIAVMALNLPAVASVLSEASHATIELSEAPKGAKPAGKVTKKAVKKQTSKATPAPASSPSVKGMNVTTMVVDKKSGTVTVTGTATGTEPLSVNGMKVTAMTVDKQSGTVTVEGTAPEQPSKYAEFPGGTPALFNFLLQNVKYPADAIEAKAEGMIVVKFNIDADGKVSDPQIMRGGFPSLEAEAKRVILSMPDWTPGVDTEGRPVTTQYTIPVTFKIPKEAPAPK